MLSGLTVAFAGSLALFTNARRQDVFAATAAYAAVLVVFVSGNFTTDSGTTTNTGMGPTAPPTLTTTLFETATVTALSTFSDTISVQSLQTTTTTESLVASPTSSIPLSTASASKKSGGLSRNGKIALGVGLGIGLPAILSSLLVTWLQMLRFKRRTHRDSIG
jgi:hypothetical protein